MNGRTFYNRFLAQLKREGMLYRDQIKLQELIEVILPIDGVIGIDDVVRGFEAVAEHLGSAEAHGARSYPRRMQTVLAKARRWKRLTLNRAVDAFITLVSCDYLERPRPRDWETDAALAGAVTCGSWEFFRLVYLHGETPAPELDTVILRTERKLQTIDTILSPEFQRRIQERTRGRDDVQHIVHRVRQTLLLQQEPISPEELELIIARAIKDRDQPNRDLN